jgi:3-phenylpropionate/trans-cinnamate dioxygenase ferredoxin reductase subunit
MLGADRAHEEIPYFFSDFADWCSLEYVGPAPDGWDEEVVRGSVEDGEFSLWYLLRGCVVGALSVERSADLDHARRLIAAGTDVSGRREVLADPGAELGGL